jgi:hypothetical protein
MDQNLIKFDENVIVEEKSKQDQTHYDIENYPDMEIHDDDTNIDMDEHTRD